MKKEIKKLENYFNRRAQSCDNAYYINGYSSNSQTNSHFYEEVTQEILQLLPINKTTKLLEVGCGSGEILSRISRVTGDTMGVDISEEMINLALKKGLNVIHQKGEILPFENDTFDVVLIYSVFTNLSQQKIANKLITEACRVLNNSGHLLIGAIPDPELSGFPQHDQLSLKNLYTKMRTMWNPNTNIGYYSYPQKYFLNLYRKLNTSSITFSRCELARSGWQTKYHALIRK